MSPARITCWRLIGRVSGLYSTCWVFVAFLAATASSFVLALDGAEGVRISLVALLARAIEPWLGCFAALITMGCWSDEIASGRLDIMLTTAVRERDFVFGKFRGAVLLMTLGLALAVILPLATLHWFSSETLAASSLSSLLLAIFVLFVQGVTFCAVGVASSAFFRHAALSACLTMLLTTALPRGIWQALLAWGPAGRTAFGEYPLDAQVADVIQGMISSGMVLTCLIATVMALFVATKAVAYRRLVGRGAACTRASTLTAIGLSLVCGVLAALLAWRVNVTLDVTAGNGRDVSLRTRTILSECEGEITVSCFLSRNNRRFGEVGALLRKLRAASDAVGGVRLTLRFVDPRWDLGAAERLVRLGALESSLVLECGRRHAFVAIDETLDERQCVSSLRRLSLPPRRNRIYWTYGHGEVSYDVYEPWGLSDVARVLVREGYENARIDLNQEAGIPLDCALVVVAAAREDFSRAELDRIDAYLRQGGRLLVLTQPAVHGGVSSALPAWGIRPVVHAFADARTISATDVIVSSFSEHAISRRLQGSQLILERPLAFAPSSAAGNGSGVDRIGFTSLASVNGVDVAVVVERGVGAGNDLALRPTRIVVVGDATFVMNGALAARACANLDFFLNGVSYLAGTDAFSATETDERRIVLPLDRAQRRRFAVAATGVVPGVIFALLSLLVRRRRRAA